MRKILSLFAAMLMALVANSAVIQINNSTPDALRTALGTAATGDVIEMAAGTYVESNADFIAFAGKEVTVQAAAGANVILQPQVSISISEGALAHFKNIKIDASHIHDAEGAWYEHIIYATDANANNRLIMEGCELYGFPLNNAAIFCGAAYKLASVTVNNCYFHDNRKSCLYFENADMASLTVTNSTFANTTISTGDESSYYAGNIFTKGELTAVNVLVDHCTFYNINCMNTDYGAVKVKGAAPAVVSNCVFMMPASYSGGRAVYNTAGTVKNCITYNYAKDSNTGLHSGPTITACSQADPLFAAAATGDFTLGTGSPALTAAEDGGAIGDPRWAPAPVPVEPNMKTIYCKMEHNWWTADGAAIGLYTWDGTTTTPKAAWPGERMTPVEGETNIWSFELDINTYPMCIFTRVNPTGDIVDWGAKSGDLVIPTDDNDMYTITSDTAVWGDPGVTGTWSKFEPTPAPVAEIDSLIIEFKDSGTSSDSSTGLTSTNIADYVSAGADYLSAITPNNKVYNAAQGYGLKFGNSSNPGNVAMKLKNAVKATSIVITASQYGATEGSALLQDSTIDITGAGGKGHFADYSYNYDGNTLIDTIIVGTKTKRGYIKSVKVYFVKEAAPVVTPKFYVTGDSALVTDAGAPGKQWNPSAIPAMNDTLVLNLKAGVDYLLKVSVNGTWEGENNVKGYNELSEKTPGLKDVGNDHNIGFKLAEAGEVKVIYTAAVPNDIFKLEGDFSVEPVAVAKDFEIDLRGGQLGEGCEKYLVVGETQNEFFDAAPAEYNAYLKANSFNGNTHGYVLLTAMVPVEAGDYKVTLGKCQYANSDPYTMAYVFNAALTDTLTSCKQNTTQAEEGGVCYHQDTVHNVATMEFSVEAAQIVKIVCAHYTPYIKVERVTPVQHTYTAAGNSDALFGESWKPALAANDLVLAEGDSLYRLEKANITLAAGKIEFKVCEDHAWTVAYPAQNYEFTIAEAGIYTIKITFNPETKAVAAEAIKTGEAVVIPTVAMHGNFSGSWKDTELFTLAQDSLTASLKINLAAGNYEFGMRIGGTGNWTANGANITRENPTTSLAEGSGNMHVTADQAGEYIFTYFFAEDSLAVTYPKLIPHYGVHEAIAAATADPATLAVNDQVYVRGIITKIEFKGKNFATYGSACIYVADASGAADTLEFYNCYSMNADTFKTSDPAYDATSTAWAQFNSVADANGVEIALGDTIEAFGKYNLFKGVHQLNQGCYLTVVNKYQPILGEPDYYLVGTMNEWQADSAYKFVKNEGAEGIEYKLTVALAENAELKVMGLVANDTLWYPDQADNYVVDAAHAGEAMDIYFRPNADGGNDWYHGVIFVPANVPELPEIALIGGMNGWDGNQGKFAPAADYKSAAWTINLDTLPADRGYAFKLLVDGIAMGSARDSAGNPFTFTPANNVLRPVDHVAVGDDEIFWLHMEDKVGEYTFIYTFADSSLKVVYPKVLPTTAPAAPTVAEDDVMALYCNHYATNNLHFEILGWGGVQTWKADTIDGVAIAYCEDMKYEFLTNWGAPKYDMSEYNKIHIDIWAPAAASVRLGIEALGVGEGGSGSKVGVVYNLNEGWNSIDAALEDFGYDFKDMKYVFFEWYKTPEGESFENNPFGFANIYFFKEAQGLNNTVDGVKAQKYIHNGMILIEKNGKVYTITGQVVR